MKVINRKEFRQIWQQLDARLGKEDSPLWIPEQHKGSRPSRWFVAVTPLALVEHDQWQQFWQWCNHNCRGQIKCYSSDPDAAQEWWGFTHQADVAWWILRWSQ